ncbi:MULTISPECIES: TIM barrel protein [Actinoplanes]|uniref:TIM barrel protein n=1 Tax=Actinoplanes sp. NBRC 101535 TaxID=3032196 RepID=UPI0005F2EFA6|nr:MULTISPECIES: TIM barrel protein [Actinoplanes]
MRLRHPSGRIVHLGCGLSLDQADSLSAAVEGLDAVTPALRSRCGSGTLGVALRLSYPLAAVLVADGRARTRLRAELDARGLEVVTLSGGPDAEDGGENTPGDWSEAARLRHTLELARILVDLLPAEEVRGAIATCGLGLREGWDETKEKAVARNLGRFSGGLADLAWRVGRAVRAGFQPGPGRVLDSPEETVAALTRIDKDRLGVCLDLTTTIRDWPDPQAGIDRMTDAGLSVITALITDPAVAWQPVLRHLLAADTARTEYVIVETSADPGQSAGDLAFVLDEMTALGLVREQEPCTAP